MSGKKAAEGNTQVNKQGRASYASQGSGRVAMDEKQATKTSRMTSKKEVERGKTGGAYKCNDKSKSMVLAPREHYW